MKAQILYGIGNIKYTETQMPVPNEKQALVRLTRCGICGSDVPRVFKTGAHNMPLIPGHEMAGIVEKCEARPELVGKRVGVFPLIPCKKCAQCLAGHYEMCESYDYLGSRRDGGFAEYVAAPVWNLLPVPDSVSDDEAAMLEPMAVAVHAMRQVGLIDGGRTQEPASEAKTQRLSEETNIVVCGLGTIGLLVAMFLRDAGYRNVFCIGNKDVQLEKLMAMGYEPGQFCDVRRREPESYILEVTDSKRADVYFECIGRSESYEQAVKCTGPLGRVMLVGNPASDMELTRQTYWQILRNQLTLQGTWNSGFNGIDGNDDDWRYVLERLADWSMGFRPSGLITHRLQLSQLQDGLDIMRRKSEEYVKIMIDYEMLDK